jgi:hypothetical protein
MNSYILVFQVGMILIVLLIVLLFESIVKNAYQRRRQFWDAIGQPRSFFWAGPKIPRPAYGAWNAMGRLWWTLLLHPPTWIQSDAQLRNQVRSFRLLYLALFLFFFAWLGVGLTSERL